MVDLSQLNPLKDFDVGFGTIGTFMLVMFLAVFILCLIGVAIFLYVNNKRFKYRIPLTKKIGNRTVRVAVYRAKDFQIGRAGDKLWYIRGVKKYISPATLQTAPNEYTHHERADGEWINVEYPDVDEEMKKMGVKYVKQDMRSNRIAIADILDARFKDKKSFWEKWGNMIMQLMFYLITTMFLVICFYQWGDIVTRIAGLIDKLDAMEKAKTGGSIVPAMILMSLRRRI